MDNLSRETCFKRPITFCGDGKVTRVVQIGLGSLKAPGIKPATYVDYGINGAFEFVSNDENVVGCIIALPREMDKTVAPWVGYGFACPEITGNVRWKLEYLYIQPNQDTSSTTPDGTLYSTDTVSTTTNGYVYTYLELDLPAPTDRIMALRFSRLGAATEDTANGVANLLQMALEYTIDKLGD